MTLEGCIGIVLWAGVLGGAETFNLHLAEAFLASGRDVVVLFVGDPYPLADQLDATGVPWVSAGLPSGRDVVVGGRRLVRLAHTHSCDALVTVAGGYLTLALRLAGYRGALISQDHGSLLNMGALRRSAAAVKRAERVFDPFTLDAQVVVSETMAGRVREFPHARKLTVIRNGVDTDYFRPLTPIGGSFCLRIGAAARLVPGKGIEHLVDAVGLLRTWGVDVSCQIAGSGPQREVLEHLVGHSDLDDVIAFRDRVDDMPGYWNSVDVCVSPSDGWIESFGMTAAEAMACGRPVVASDRGGLREVLRDGVTGVLVPAGDPVAVAHALRVYADSREILRLHGIAARAEAVRELGITQCAQRYLGLIDELVR